MDALDRLYAGMNDMLSLWRGPDKPLEIRTENRSDGYHIVCTHAGLLEMERALRTAARKCRDDGTKWGEGDFLHERDVARAQSLYVEADRYDRMAKVVRDCERVA